MQTRHFGSQILAFLFFHETLQLDEFEGVVSNMTTAFSNSSPKIPKSKAFFLLKYFLFLDETSRNEKLDGTDFENDNKSFFKFQPKNTQKLESIFFFSEILSELNLFSRN